MLKPLFSAALLSTTLLASNALGQMDPLTGPINDQAIEADIEKRGTALIEAKKTVSSKDFQTQLRNLFTEAKLPAETATAISDREAFDYMCKRSLVVTGLYLCGRCDRYHPGCASGFMISEDGLAVTNHHVMESSRNFTNVVRLHDGTVLPVLEVLAADDDADVAIIRIAKRPDGKKFDYFPIARDVKVGDKVHCVSNPDGRFYNYTQGYITRHHLSRTGRHKRMVPWYTVSADYAKGSSGAPMVNDRGQVVGLVCSTNSIYYTERGQQQNDLQMVMRNCTPASEILARFDAVKAREAKAKAEAAAAKKAAAEAKKAAEAEAKAKAKAEAEAAKKRAEEEAKKPKSLEEVAEEAAAEALKELFR